MDLVKAIECDGNLYAIDSVVKITTKETYHHFGRIINIDLNSRIVKLDCSTYYNSKIVELYIFEIKDISFYPKNK